MERFKETLYDVMGLPPDAPAHDIGRAWNRYRSQMRAEATPPDPRRDALMRHAYETLSDEHRRAAYDRTLRRESPVVRAASRSPRLAATVVIAFLAAAGALAWWLHAGYAARRDAAALPKMKSVEEIRNSLVRSVGRVKLVDLSGRESLLGLAVTIEDGVMATACTGLTPTAEPQVVVPPRTWPARVAGYDPSGVCRLEVHGGGGFPLQLTGEAPWPGSTVYTVDISPKGEATLREGQVTRLGGGDRRALQATVPVTRETDGRPLLDADGRLAAIGIVDDSGGGVYVPIPKTWLARETPVFVSPPVVREAPPPVEGGARKSPVEISPERQQRLQEAFRPPPKVPDDL